MDDGQKRRVRRLVSGGYTVPEIADRMGVAQQRVYRLCQSEGLDVVRVRNKLPESIVEIRRCVVELGSVDAAATHYGVTRAAIYYRLSKARRTR